MTKISQASYLKARKWLKDKTGVELGDNRQMLVQSRLNRRLRELNIGKIDDYFSYLESLKKNHPEWAHFIDLLTTHETYFFREGQHFDFIKQIIFPQFRGKKLDILSAACSTGEETFSIAMECMEYFGSKANWTIIGTDIAEGTIETARRALYSQRRAKNVPQNYLQKYMLKGKDDAEGLCMIKKDLREHVKFSVDNILSSKLKDSFDIIFCRNVLIYFDEETKKTLINNLFQQLNPGGHLFVSQTEQMRGHIDSAFLINSSIARRPTNDSL
ncbi:protein-glutamate O-methyltransferase CheR [Aliikangiella marina]|uniref:Chemotaxis protein methyltransferase n=1 Tax=Aliikangiella marina TaxID=1712262 RepID=A0A545T555_9GAMM|nr:protein-glutamate O-methyltransferase CheR [Aliikangiella marina]TQV72298.1 protein-glutamate O-methyltransferase CheR [Aliikangiella marina]